MARTSGRNLGTDDGDRLGVDRTVTADRDMSFCKKATSVLVNGKRMTVLGGRAKGESRDATYRQQGCSLGGNDWEIML